MPSPQDHDPLYCATPNTCEAPDCRANRYHHSNQWGR